MEEWLDFEQVTVKLKLLFSHVAMLGAELLPFFIRIMLLLVDFSGLLRQVTLVLPVAIIVLELNVM